MNRDELTALPAVLDVPTAAEALGLSRTSAYELIRTSAWPVFPLGKLIRIPTAPLLDLLGIVGSDPPAQSARRALSVRGHVYKRGSTCSYNHDLPRREDGRRRQTLRGGFASKREAQAAMAESLARLAKGQHQEAGRLTLGAASCWGASARCTCGSPRPGWAAARR